MPNIKGAANWNAGGHPTASNDSTQGYSKFSQWYSPATGGLWICLDAPEGAAVWRRYKLDDSESNSQALSFFVIHDQQEIASGNKDLGYATTRLSTFSRTPEKVFMAVLLQSDSTANQEVELLHMNPTTGAEVSHGLRTIASTGGVWLPRIAVWMYNAQSPWEMNLSGWIVRANNSGGGNWKVRGVAAGANLLNL